MLPPRLNVNLEPQVHVRSGNPAAYPPIFQRHVVQHDENIVWSDPDIAQVADDGLVQCALRFLAAPGEQGDLHQRVILGLAGRGVEMFRLVTDVAYLPVRFGDAQRLALGLADSLHERLHLFGRPVFAYFYSGERHQGCAGGARGGWSSGTGWSITNGRPARCCNSMDCAHFVCPRAWLLRW